MTELRSCPFCGCKPIIHQGKKTGCQLHGEPMQGIVVECNFHGCPAKPRLEAGDIYNGGQDKAIKEAVDLWNTRHPPADAKFPERLICTSNCDNEKWGCTCGAVSANKMHAQFTKALLRLGINVKESGG